MADDNTIKDSLERIFNGSNLEDLKKQLESVASNIVKQAPDKEDTEELSSAGVDLENVLEELFEVIPEIKEEFEKGLAEYKNYIDQVKEGIKQGSIEQKTVKDAIGLQRLLYNRIKQEIDQRKTLNEKIQEGQKAKLGVVDFSAGVVNIKTSSANINSQDGNIEKTATATASSAAIESVNNIDPGRSGDEADRILEIKDLSKLVKSLNQHQEALDKQTQEALDKKKKDDSGKFFDSARAKITDIISMVTGGASILQLLFKGSAKDAIVFGREMRLIAYEVEGIGSSTRGLQNEFANLGKDIAQQTGYPLDVIQESYMKNIKKGIIQQNKSTKSQKEGLKVIKSGLNLSQMIGANSENTADLFGDWHRTLKLSSQQMAQLSRDTKQIARSTGVTGDHLIEAMKSSEGILKNLQNQGNLTSSAMKNVIKAMTEAKKLGVEDSFGKIGDALSSTNKLFFEADDKTKAFLFQMAGRLGEFDSMSAGTFMKSRSNMKKMGEGMESMMIEMAQGLGADVKNFEDLNKLTADQRKSLAIQLKARTGMEIGEFEKLAGSFKKGGESLGDTLSGLDKVLKSSVSTTEERRKAQEEIDKTLMQGGLSMLNTVSEQISKTGGDVSSALKNLDEETKKNLEQDISGVAERMGKDISKLSEEQKLQLAGVASAEKLQKAAGAKGLKVEDFSSQLKSAIGKGDSAGFRDIVERMNEAAEKVDIKDKASVDPIEKLGQTITEMNEVFRGVFSKAASAITFALGSLGILFIALAAEMSALTFAIGGTKFAEHIPGNIGELKKTINKISAPFSKFKEVFKQSRTARTREDGAFGTNKDSVSLSNWNSIEFYKKLRQLGSSPKEARDKVKNMGGSFYGPNTLFESFKKAGDAFMETITGKAGMISGAFAKASAFMVGPFGKILTKALGPAVLLLGGIKGVMESAEAGRTKTEGAILGALTGGAKTGSFLSSTLGVEKGSVADKTLGVGGAAAWGAMAGAAISVSLGGMDLGTSVIIGAIIGAFAEIVKIITEGTDILQNIFKPVKVVADFIYFIFQDIYDVLAGIVTLDIGRIFKGIFNAIGSTLALIPRFLMGIIEAVFIGLPKLILKSIGMIWEIPRMLMQSILDGLASLAENSWVGPIFKTLHDAFKALFDGFMAVWTPISEIFSGLYTVFSDLGKALFGAGEGGGVLSGALWILQKAVWGVAYVISWLLSPIILLAHALGLVLKIVGALVKGIIAPFQWLYEKLVGHSIVPDLVVAIVSWFAKLPILIFKSLLAIPKMIGNALSGIGSYLEGFGDVPIIGPIIAQIGNLVGFIGESIKLLSEGLGHIFDIIQGIFTLDPSKIWEGIKGIGSVVVSSLSNVGSFLYDSIINSLGGLGSFLLGSLKTAFIDLPTYIFNGFKSALQGIWDWITSWIPGMKSAQSAASGYSENATEQAATMAKEGPSTAHAIGGLAGAGADLLQLDVGEAASKAGLALKEGVYAAGENLKTAAESAWGGVKAVGSYLNPFNYFEEGTRKIEEPGLAMLHQGEMVIPADLTNKITAEGNGAFGTIKPDSQSLGSVGGTFLGSAAGSFVGSSMANPSINIDIDESVIVKAMKDSFKFTKKLAGNIKKYADSSFSGMSDYFSNAFVPLTTGFSRSMEAGQGIFTAMSRGIKGQYMSITKGKSISEIASSAFYNIQNLVPESIKNYAASAFGTIQNLVPESIKNYASSAFSNISNGFSNIGDQFSSAFSPMIKGFTRSMEAGEGIFTAVSRGITGQYMSITKGKSISEIASSAFENLKTVPNLIKNYASSAFGKIQNLVPESVKNYASSAFGKIQNLVPESVKNYAGSAFSKVSSGISNAFAPLTTEFTKSMKAGEGMFNSLSKGIKSQFMSVKGGLFKEGGFIDNQKKNLQDKLFGRKADFAKGDLGQKGILQAGKEKLTSVKNKVFGKIDPITGEKSRGLIDQTKDKAGAFYQATKDKLFGRKMKPGEYGPAAPGLVTKVKDKGINLFESTKEKLGFGKKEAASIEAVGSAGSKIGLMEKARDGLRNLAEGIKAFANKDVLLGALNLIPTAIGLVAMVPGFVGAKLIEKLNGEKIGQSLIGLANGLSQMASGKVLLGSGALVLASLALLAMLPALPVLAILGSMSALITSGLTALSVGLSTFGAAAANPLLWLGILAIGALGVAMIPFGYALSALSPLVIAFGSAIQAAFSGIGEIITSIATGMTMFLGAVSLEKAAGLVAVAGGLAVLSAAMIAFSAATAVAGWVSFFGGDGVVNKIMELAAAGPNLKMFADSITSMSTGIKEFASQLAGLGDMEKNVDEFIEISKKLSSASSDIMLPETSVALNSNTIPATQTSAVLSASASASSIPPSVSTIEQNPKFQRNLQTFREEGKVIEEVQNNNIKSQRSFSTLSIPAIERIPATNSISNLEQNSELQRTSQNLSSIEPTIIAAGNISSEQVLPTSKSLEQSISPTIETVECCCKANNNINKASIMPDLSGFISSLSSGLKSAFVDFPVWLGGKITSGLKSVFVDLPMWLGGIIIGGLKSVFVDLPMWLGGIIIGGLKSVFVDLPMWLGGIIIGGLKSVFVDLPMWLGGMIASGLKSVFVDLPMWIGGIIIGGIKSIFIDLPMWLGGLVVSGIKKIFVDLPMWLGGLIVNGIKAIFIDLPVWLMSTIVGGITSLMGAIPGAIYNALYWAASKVGLGWVVKSLAGGGGAKKEEGSGGKEEGLLSKAWGGIKSVGSTVANAASGAWGGVKSAGSSVANAASSAWEGFKGFFGFGKEEVSLESILPLMAEFYKAGVSGSGVLVRHAEKVAAEAGSTATPSEATTSLFNDKNGRPDQNGIMWVDPMQLVNRANSPDSATVAVNNAAPLNQINPPATVAVNNATPLNQINSPATVAVNNAAPLNQINPPATVAGAMGGKSVYDLNANDLISNLGGSESIIGNSKKEQELLQSAGLLDSIKKIKKYEGDTLLQEIEFEKFSVKMQDAVSSGLIKMPVDEEGDFTGWDSEESILAAEKYLGKFNNSISANPPATVAVNNAAPLNQINPPATVAVNNATPLNQINSSGLAFAGSTLGLGVLGALTGDAKTGSTMSKYLGVEEGSTTDKVLGVGGAAATGAMTGAAIGSIIPVVGTALGAGIGGLLGGGAELYKWATEKKVPQPPKTDLEKLNNLNTSIDGSLSGSQDLLNKHAVPMARPTEVEARPITEGTADVQPVHLRDIGQTILREKTSASSGTGKLQSDELTRMEETAYKQVEELEQIKEGINELVALMKPRGGGSIAGASNQTAGSTRDPRRPMHSAIFGKMKFGYPSGTANKDVLRTGE